MPDVSRHGLSPDLGLLFVGPVTNQVTGQTVNLVIHRKSDDGREMFGAMARRIDDELGGADGSETKVLRGCTTHNERGAQ